MEELIEQITLICDDTLHHISIKMKRRSLVLCMTKWSLRTLAVKLTIRTFALFHSQNRLFFFLRVFLITSVETLKVRKWENVKSLSFVPTCAMCNIRSPTLKKKFKQAEELNRDSVSLIPPTIELSSISTLLSDHFSSVFCSYATNNYDYLIIVIFVIDFVKRYFLICMENPEVTIWKCFWNTL